MIASGRRSLSLLREYPDDGEGHGADSNHGADGLLFLEEPLSHGSPEERDLGSIADVVSGEWEIVRPGGDCECSDGTEYAFFVRHADPAKVVFFLQGGGACFSADTCNPSNGTYDPNIDSRDNPALLGGIFDSARPDQASS